MVGKSRQWMHKKWHYRNYLGPILLKARASSEIHSVLAISSSSVASSAMHVVSVITRMSIQLTCQQHQYNAFKDATVVIRMQWYRRGAYEIHYLIYSLFLFNKT